MATELMNGTSSSDRIMDEILSSLKAGERPKIFTASTLAGQGSRVSMQIGARIVSMEALLDAYDRLLTPIKTAV